MTHSNTEINAIYSGNNNSYVINDKDLNSIHGIEALTAAEAEALYIALLHSEKHIIKGFTVYFIDLGGYFGFSALVFKNNHHIYYANDYELHHKHMTREELRNWYLNTLSNKLYTEEEIMEGVANYDDFHSKDYFVRNYWIQQFDYLSMFRITRTEKESVAFDSEIAQYKYFNNVSFCYTNDKNALKNIEFIKHLDKEFELLKTNNDKFRDMIRYELRNHEAGYTYDYRDALDTLGLNFNRLTAEQQRIVKAELNRCIEEAC